MQVAINVRTNRVPTDEVGAHKASTKVSTGNVIPAASVVSLAFQSKGVKDIILEENSENFIIQVRENLVPIEGYIIPKHDHTYFAIKGMYDELVTKKL